MRPYALFLFAMLCATVSASPPTAAEHAADVVAEALKNGAAKSAGIEGQHDFFAQQSRHIVFLIDTSQFSKVAPRWAHAQAFVNRLLTILGKDQKKFRETSGKSVRHAISICPYQLSLNPLTPGSIQEQPLSSDLLPLVDRAIGTKTIFPAGYVEGHNSSFARQQAMKHWTASENSQFAGTFFIQVTSVDRDIDPSKPSGDVDQVTARKPLKDSGYIEYPVTEVFKTDEPGNGGFAKEVYIWCYGPQNLTPGAIPKVTPAPKSGTGAEAGPPASSKLPFKPILFGIVIVAVGAYLFWPRRDVRVKTNGGTIIVPAGKTASVVLSGAGVKREGLFLALAPTVRGTFPDGTTLGELRHSRRGILTFHPQDENQLCADETVVASLRLPSDNRLYLQSADGSRKTAEFSLEAEPA